MKPTKTILIGAPLSGHEAQFLRTICTDLEGIATLVLANFNTPKRQIDFVVVTPNNVSLLELKNFTGPIFGDQNGVWTFQDSAGARVAYSGENPWQQTMDEKFALSDEMLKFQQKSPGVPRPAGRGYFVHFNAFVCIYPEIHPQSSVTRGDHKVRVASYKEVLNAITAKSISSPWNPADWQRFAVEQLKLTEVSIDEATDPIVNQASGWIRSYRSRLQDAVGTRLPPLLSSPSNSNYGEGLINRLRDDHKNVVLVGPSGSAKTFHLDHLALAIERKGQELPILLEARKYRGGDFWTLVRGATAPLFPRDPAELFEAMRLCGLRPVLMLDGLNLSTETQLRDLIRGIQAFGLRYEGRFVLASQTPVALPNSVNACEVKLLPPDMSQKRAIYGYHSSLEPSADLDYLCSGFTNAYDLSVAGRCHSTAKGGVTRVELYDRYVRRFLPAQSAVALLRTLAGEMWSTLSVTLSRDEFETKAEEFLTKHQAPWTMLDALCQSRLIELTDQTFSFEHDLLFDYFKAENIRKNFRKIEELAEDLKRPRNQNLIELLLPRFSEPADISILLEVANDVATLCRVIEGQCGALAQSQLLSQCEALLDDAIRDLSALNVTIETSEADGRRHFVRLCVKGERKWTSRDGLLFNLIALNLENERLQGKFLDLLDLWEWTLRAGVKKAAALGGFKPGSVWSHAVGCYGGVVQSTTEVAPCSAILAALRIAAMSGDHYVQGTPLREKLRERSCREPQSDFALTALIEELTYSRKTTNAATILELVSRAWDSGIGSLRMSALHLLECMRSQIQDDSLEDLHAVRNLLQSFETKDIFLNTQLLETLAVYDCLELTETAESALSEMRAVIAPNAINEPSITELATLCQVSPTEYLRAQAYGLLGKIFEDVFQGVYYEAYTRLADDEKGEILCLAADRPELGFHTDWIVGELFKYGGKRALPVFERFASRIDAGSFSVQDSVAAFVLGIEGCARFRKNPPYFMDGDSPECRAWRLFGEILFWMFRQKEIDGGSPAGIERLWSQLDRPTGLASADVLYQLHHSRWRLGVAMQSPVFELIKSFPSEIGEILEQCIKNRESLTSLFRNGGGNRDGNIVRFLIQISPQVDTSTMITTLRQIADDPEFGKDAIDAIESIQRTAKTR